MKCEGKKCFASFDAAMPVARVANRKVYQCDKCKQWHLDFHSKMRDDKHTILHNKLLRGLPPRG